MNSPHDCKRRRNHPKTQIEMAAAAITEKFVGSIITEVLSPATSGKPSAAATASNSCSANNNNNGHSCYNHEEVVVGMDVVEDHHHHQQKVPIWVGLNCKLVSGISKFTTCHDLISSMVPSSEDPSKYVLVEKWKKMERVLDPSVKILKVWKAWGDQIGDVSFVLRSSPAADGYIDKKSSRKVHRKRSSTYHQQKEEDCDKEGHRDAMEQLIKLVLTQGEAIQAQLKKLRQQEVQIERYEDKMHKIRSSQMGENYVVDTYLKDDVAKGTRRIKRREKSPCKRDAHGNHHHHHHHHHHRQTRREQLLEQSVKSVCDTDPPKKASTCLPSPPVENTEDVEVDVEDSAEFNDESSELIKEKTELMENIFQLNVKLTQEEERLVKLGLKIRKLSDKQRKAEWEELAMQDINQELEHLKQITNEQSKEIEINERNLTALEQLLDDKHDHVAILTHEIQLIDEQSELLQRKVMEIATLEAAGNGQQPVMYEQSQQAFPSRIDLPLGLNLYHQEQLDYREDEEGHLIQCEMKSPANMSSRGDLTSYKIPHQQLCPSTTRYKCPKQQASQPLQQSPSDGCSSSCSNSSSSVCVHLNQKQCTATSNSNISSDPQDNDSNSDTGISSLHSSVDENPMYVLDTLV